MNPLEKLRSDRATWDDLAFAACHSEDRGTFDGNASARFRVLLALQHDRREADVELIRYLFVNEIIAAEKDSFQGCDDALMLAAFLLARYREPSDARLFAHAKLANFDTACGFPMEFIFVASEEQTESRLKETDPILWEQLASSFEFTMTSNGLYEWWQSHCRDYPDSEGDEHLLALYKRALAFDDRQQAVRYLEAWAAQEPDSHAKQSKLKYEYARLGNYKKSAEVAARMVDLTETPWDRASAQQALLKLQRQAGEFHRSLNTAHKLDETFASIDEWVGVGLGRMAIHQVFELALSHPDTADANQAFSLADRWFQRSRDLALVGMESGAKAAQRCGLTEKAKEYEQMARTERQRISALTS